MTGSHLGRSLPGSGRVLVIDDGEANLRLLEGILEHAGYREVRLLRDSSEFEQVLSEFCPDIVLLDLHMPPPDGFEILACLAALRPDEFLPVIVLTGDATDEARARALSAGANDFLTKPFDAHEVILRVGNLLQTRSLYRRLQDHNASLVGDVAEREADLARSEGARAAVVEALDAIPGDGDLAAVATAVCRRVARHPGLGRVILLGFAEPDAVTIHGAAGAEGRLASGDRVSGDESRSMYDRAHGGPWIDRVGSRPTISALADSTAPVVWVPLTHDNHPIGVLAAEAVDGADGELRELTRTLTDYAAVARALVLGPLMSEQRQAALRAEIESVIVRQAFTPVFQPVADLETRLIVGAEALTRFADGVRPDLRFESARSMGLAWQLEEATMRAALDAASKVPASGWLSLNVSPDVLVASEPIQRLIADQHRPVVLELTEHVPVVDYAALRTAIAALGPDVRVAVDDAGAGFASFRHILELCPDFVKLDIGLVRGIDADPSRQALVAGMRYFAQKTGCTLIAEGIEKPEEARMLRSLAVRIGQGHLFGRPQPLAAHEPSERRPTDSPGVIYPRSRAVMPGRR